MKKLDLNSGEIDEIEQCFAQVGARSREVCGQMDQGAQDHFKPMLDTIDRRRAEIVATLRRAIQETA